MPSSLSDYEILEVIGSGSYGVCKKIKRKKDAKVLVWKELDYSIMSEVEKQLLVSEVNVLRELRHEHIVRYYDRIIDRSSSTLYIIMEYCEGGDVDSLINKVKKEGKRIEEPFVWKICIQILLALQECHSRTKNGKVVLHRDLKPANVFLDSDNNVKLGDFGFARVLNHDTSFAKSYVGTPYYMSPEQMNHMLYNEKTDVWSLGCLLYELTALKRPFTATAVHELTSKINKGRFARIPFYYSDDLNRLVCMLLQVDDRRRPSVEEILDHPIIQKEKKKLQGSSSASDSAGSDLSSKRSGSAASSDEGYSSKMDLLKKKEQDLKEREKALKERENAVRQRERELEARERSLQAREKIADERLARAERLSKLFKDIKIQMSENDDMATLQSKIDRLKLVRAASSPVLTGRLAQAVSPVPTSRLAQAASPVLTDLSPNTNLRRLSHLASPVLTRTKTYNLPKLVAQTKPFDVMQDKENTMHNVKADAKIKLNNFSRDVTPTVGKARNLSRLKEANVTKGNNTTVKARKNFMSPTIR